MPIALAMLAALASKTPTIDKWSVPIWMALSFTILFLSLTIIFCLCATFPRTDSQKPSNIFFGGITSKNIDDFTRQIEATKKQEILTDLSHQIHINAQIASIKYTWIQRALFTLIIASIFWGFAIFILWLR